MKIITPKEMQLADVVRLEGSQGAYSDQTVKQIKDGYVTFFRPYTHTGDFAYTGGVICYTGIEEYTVSIGSSLTYVLIERKALK